MDRLLGKYAYTFSSFINSFLGVYNLNGGRRNYNTSVIMKKSDNNAIKEDWISVGNDIRNSIQEYSKYGKK